MTRLRRTFVAVACLAFLPADLSRVAPDSPAPPCPPTLRTFSPTAAHDMARTLDSAWSQCTPPHEVPAVAPRNIPHGMRRLEASSRKRAFVQALLPHIVVANRTILSDRDFVLECMAHVASSRNERGGPAPIVNPSRLLALCRAYRVTPPSPYGPSVSHSLRQLLERIDVIPPSLALAQAAIESGWGTSRFTTEGNALFGQWVFDRSAGMTPYSDAEGDHYAIARFEDIGASVEAYMLNLNRLGAYEGMRLARRELRERQLALTGLRLADGIAAYSTRRRDYVAQVKDVIRTNEFHAYDRIDATASLTPVAWSLADGREAPPAPRTASL